MILSESLVLLFSRSGVGKTSLINAGLLEELRRKGFFPVVVRITHDAKGGPTNSVYECVEEQAARGGITITGGTERHSLWQYFLDEHFAKEGQSLRPVLILDQFEELFTVVRSNKEAFIKDLADLARHRVPEDVRIKETARLEKISPEDPERRRIVSLLYEGEGPDVKILISIREDFLAEMETLKSQIPTIFRNSLRLEPLTIDQARKAIESPIQQSELLGDKAFTYGTGVVDELLDFLRTQKVGGELIRGDSVEPVQLQILCKYLYRESMEKKKRQEQQRRRTNAALGRVVPEITVTDLKGRHGMKRAIIGYYRKVLRQFPHLRLGWSTRKYWPSLFNFLLFHRTRAAIRHLCETKLVTPAGYRNSLSIDVIKSSIGVSDRDLDRLVDERLLRTEPRLGSRFYELTHDTLIRPLINTRRKRRVYWVASLFSLLIAIAYAPALASNIFWYMTVRPLKHEASSATNKEERIAALREVLGSGYRDCSGCDLTELDLHSLHVGNVNFSRAQLRGADLNGASIISSDFSGANLYKANLTHASLDFSDFTDAMLTEAVLIEADLQSADLNNAQLKDAKLAGARLEDADFTEAVIDGADFKETRWWLATGWSRQSIDALQQKWPHENVVESEVYKKEIKDFDVASDSPGESGMLNARAWFRATCGVELDKAEADARRSLALDPASERRMDTLGYILLQRGKYDEAEPLLLHSLQIRQGSEADPLRIGLAHYHLALALDRLGNYAEAQSHFDQAKTKQYIPSHECVLIPPSDPKNCSWPNLRKSK